jgi:hypothetical protein
MMRNTTQRTLLVKHVSPHITSATFPLSVTSDNLRWPRHTSIIHEFKHMVNKLFVRRNTADLKGSENVVGFSERLSQRLKSANNSGSCPRRNGRRPLKGFTTAISNDKGLEVLNVL